MTDYKLDMGALETALQKAFELGGLEDGSYHLEADEIVQVIRAAAPAVQGEPVAVLYADGTVLTKAECGASFAVCCKVQTPLYAAPQPVEQQSGTNSDKYRAELYDEMWNKAKDMGYGNVINALIELERLKQQPAPGDARMVEQHHRDSAELRRLCQARDDQRDGRLAALERAVKAETDVARMAEALETIKRIAEHPPQDKAILGIVESALAARRKQGGDKA